MYSCVLHQWNSFERPCPICWPSGITSDSTELIIEQPSTPTDINKKDKLLDILAGYRDDSYSDGYCYSEIEKLFASEKEKTIEELKESVKVCVNDYWKLEAENERLMSLLRAAISQEHWDKYNIS